MRNRLLLLVGEFIKTHIKPYKKAKELIKKYQNERCIVISATADFLVQKIALNLGIQETIAIKCECLNEKFSGKTQKIYSFKEDKILRFKEYLRQDYEKWMKILIFQ